MKKLVIGLMFVANIASAACIGPFCWDERGAYVSGSIENGNGDAMPSATSSTINAATPDVAGQEVWCSDCGNFNSKLGMICISSGTTRGAYIAVSSATAVTDCR